MNSCVLSMVCLLGLVSLAVAIAVDHGHNPLLSEVPPDSVPPPKNKLLGSWAKYTGGPSCPGKRNFIFMVSDGFGPASETIAREFLQYQLLSTNKLAIDDLESVLPLDEMLVGAVRTKSASSWVTDSAAAATAMATGHKTFNDGIGVNENFEPVGTVLEAAKRKGYTTALVVTSKITHATPACWSSHVAHRDEENTIATHQIGDYPLGRSVDLMFGGGLGHFIPRTTPGSFRDDDRDLLQEARNKHGWNTIITTRAELDTLNKTKTVLPMMGLFATGHLDYEIDRDPKQQASLSEMVDAALTVLADATSDCSSPGFFLMIEGSRVDMAAHSNDSPTHIHEILQYQNVVSVVKSFVEMNPNTRAISVSDHETGAVSKAWQVDRMEDQCLASYEWHPENLVSVTMSIEKLAPQILQYQGPDLRGFVQDVIRTNWGVSDLSAAEIDEVILRRDDQNACKFPGYVFPIEVALSKITSKRALVGWNTNGHSGVDTNLYAINAPDLKGLIDNTYLATYSAKALGYGVYDEMLTLKGPLSAIHVNRPSLLKRSARYSHGHHH